jgi:hypothetical protein
MRCRTCNYPLWNTKARVCSECGSGFKPSDFDFEPGRVTFQCPHCSTGYYGMSARGHLVPASFRCSGCAQQVSMDEMSLVPLEGGLDSTPTQDGSNPWYERSTLVRPFLTTTVMLLQTPSSFGRSMPADASLGPAAIYVSIAFGVQMILTLALQAALFALLSAFMVGVAGAAFGGGFVMRQVVQSAIFGLGFGLVWLLLESVLTFGLLRVFGGQGAGLQRTIVCYAFTSGAGAVLLWFAAVPCLGALLALAWIVWSIVIAVQLISASMRISIGTAVAAVLFSRIIMLIVGFGLLFAALFVAPQAIGLPAGIAGVFTGRAGSTMASGLHTARLATGAWPTSPTEPFLNDPLGAVEFLSYVDRRAPDPGFGAARTSQVFTAGGMAAFAAESDALATRMPPPRTPFRIGTAIFLYPASDGDPDDWLFIVDYGLGRPVEVHRAFDMELLRPSEFEAELAAFEARRAARGLAPLPDLGTLPDLKPAPAPPPTP